MHFERAAVADIDPDDIAAVADPAIIATDRAQMVGIGIDPVAALIIGRRETVADIDRTIGVAARTDVARAAKAIGVRPAIVAPVIAIFAARIADVAAVLA